ncbi:ABC transporter ATP-binding protein [Mesoaciditoga lauensis]|uniref:ABC transporter ATP-binding protein n=1 Tax=Mesoaciditoga lauensis TaxID=1495039 RepID=UPI0005690BBA|nr:ABC transporter ATP-binding protein [Mesoaciditoga lauensis]
MGLKLEHVQKIFKTKTEETVAVKDFSLNVEKGELVTLLGPSGCGKTTTLRMIAGFEVPTNGRIILEGQDVTNMPPNKRDISMMFQSYALFPHMTVRQNIEFGLRIKRTPRDEINQKVKPLIKLVGLEGMENRRPDQISGGQQQRIALVRSLVMEPSVLLFDEPLSNLDAKLRETMRLEIRRIQKKLNITSVYVTHDQVEAMSISDRIVVMNLGQIMQIGSPKEIYSHPQNKFVADFIGKVNFIYGTIDEVLEDGYVVYSEELQQKFVGISSGKFKKGDEVIITLRPEAITYDEKDKKENSLEGKTRQYVYLGTHVEYGIELKNGKILNTLLYNPSENKGPLPNEDVKLYFSKQSCWIIPKD